MAITKQSMTRFQIYLTRDQVSKLREKSNEENKSIAEIIRRYINSCMLEDTAKKIKSDQEELVVGVRS